MICLGLGTVGLVVAGFMTDVSIVNAALAASVSPEDSGSAAASSPHTHAFGATQSEFARVLEGMAAAPTLSKGERITGAPADRQTFAEAGKALPEVVSLAGGASLVPAVPSGFAVPLPEPEVSRTHAPAFTALPEVHIAGTSEPRTTIRPTDLSGETLVAAEQENGVQISAAPNAKGRVVLPEGQTATAAHGADTLRGGTTSGGSSNSMLQPPAPSELTPPVTRLVLPSTPDSSGWQEGFSTRLNWMVKEGIQFAELRIRPPEMGLIEVRIAVSQQEASIAFAAQHGAVRDAIESTLPRLREMLNEGGISLENVDVSEHSLSREPRAVMRFEAAEDWQGPSLDESEAEPISEHPQHHHGLVDRYA